MFRSTRLAVATTLGALLAGCAVVAPQAIAPGSAADGAARCTAPFSTLVARRAASVVDISTLRSGPALQPDAEPQFLPQSDFADGLAWPLPAGMQLGPVRDIASGVILSADGLILTSAHVTAQVDEVQVRLDDGRRFAARLVGADPRTDIALLKIDASGLPAATFGDAAALAPGDWVAAIGAPFGFHGSVTTGVISARNRTIGGVGDIPYLQTDVAINPGSSGSPLFDRCGDVVAINSLIYSGNGGYMGMSFAVPIDLALDIAAQLRVHGSVRRGYLGADVQEVTPALARAFALPRPVGALVTRVAPGSPAEAAGVRIGDIVTRYDGTTIGHFTDLLRKVSADAPAARRELALWRLGATQALQVTLAEQRAAPAALQPTPAPEAMHGLGLGLIELTATQRARLQAGAALVVREATGAARSAGIRTGDLVVALNGVRLERIEEFRQGLGRMAPDRPAALLILRDHRLAYVPVRVDAQAAPRLSTFNPREEAPR